jgi:DMSO/TMAO reductase YedYZ molybdopterin-dependent catalytic subunit
MTSHEILNLMECAGNSRSTMQPAAEGVQWDHGAVSSASWRGVPVSAVLDRAVVGATAKDVLFDGADHGDEKHGADALHYAMSIPMEKALHPDTILAFEMNGAPLTPEHGFPLRLLVPGWYGMASVKWLSSIKLITKPNGGFHETDYCVYPADGGESHRVTKIQVKSLITSPALREKVPMGARKIKGVAWAGECAIAKVEVSTDDAKSWHPANLENSDSSYSWQHWQYDWAPTRTGHHLLRVRATDAEGNLQPIQARWNYRGYVVNSVHAVPVIVQST